MAITSEQRLEGLEKVDAPCASKGCTNYPVYRGAYKRNLCEECIKVRDDRNKLTAEELALRVDHRVVTDLSPLKREVQ